MWRVSQAGIWAVVRLRGGMVQGTRTHKKSRTRPTSLGKMKRRHSPNLSRRVKTDHKQSKSDKLRHEFAHSQEIVLNGIEELSVIDQVPTKIALKVQNESEKKNAREIESSQEASVLIHECRNSSCNWHQNFSTGIKYSSQRFQQGLVVQLTQCVFDTVLVQSWHKLCQRVCGRF